MTAFEADGLINAAETMHRHAAVDYPLVAWQNAIEVNLRPMFRLSREFARTRISASASGVIVNVASVESFTASPGHLAYTASKAVVAMLTKAFALELATHGIRVVAIAPLVDQSDAGDGRLGEAERAAPASIPMGRGGRAEEHAAAIAFLASDETSYITGAILRVDGGWLTA